MPSKWVLPPLEFCRGTSPIQAALPRVLKVVGIAGADYQCAGCDRPYSRNRLQSSAHLAAAMPLHDLPFEFAYLAVEFLEVLQQPVDE